MNINKKLGISAFVLAFIIGSISMVAYQTNAKQENEGSTSSIVPLKEAKLNIEHNATALDTGFQGAVDSEGWKELTFSSPKGKVLKITGLGSLAKLGLTELFFESVEPENVDVPIEEMLAKLPAGSYSISGPGIENGESTGKTRGAAWLTHNIPAGPVLLQPVEESVVRIDKDLEMKWGTVTKTIDGKPVKIISYQLIVEKISDPHPHMIGKMNSLSMYLPASVTSMKVSKEFLEPGALYDWEVLAIEESGNQTLSSGKFSTE